MSCWVTTQVVYDDVDGFETWAAATCLLCRFDCGREDGAADPSAVGKALELRCDRAEVAANVVIRIELSPFFKRGRVLGVKTFQAEINTSDSRGETVGERVTDSSVGACFGFVVGAVKLADGRQSSCKGGEVGGRADHVPSTLKYEGLGIYETWELKLNNPLK